MAISTASNPKYWQSNLLSIRSTSVGNFPDFLSDRLNDLIESITSYEPYTVRGGDRLTNISFQFYNTTSLYYIILHFNGLLFWSDVQAGDIIQIPDRSQIDRFFGRNIQQIGQRITI